MTFLAQGAVALGLTLSKSQLDAFQRYAVELRAWNERFNLTTISEPARIETHHFLDSLSALPVLGATMGMDLATLLGTHPRAIDVGSGPGLPGLALKIAWPSLQLTLLEATGKKVTFLRHVVDLLALTEVDVIHGRAEEFGRKRPGRERFELVMARAVAPLPVLLEYLLPLSAVKGWVMAYKGARPAEEAAAAEAALATLGGELVLAEPLSVPGLHEQRSLILVRKIAPTPPRYPRNSGVIRERPLGTV